MITTATEWRRLARPQDDGYDTEVITDAAGKRYDFVKHIPSVRETKWLGGMVKLRNDAPLPGPNLLVATLDDPHIALGEQYLAAWPACFAQAQRLLETVYVFDFGVRGARGCVCGPVGSGSREDSSPFGDVFSTVFDPVGLIEGVVHEMAHWKLHALGVHFEDWDDGLLLNAPTELFVSSVRKDKLRPMGAVLHAHWVYIHVLAANIACLPLRPDDSAADWTNIHNNASRTREGQAVVATDAKWTPAGAEFWAGVQEWTNELLAVVDAHA